MLFRSFYVLDMENGDQNAPMLLGKPFLKTSKTNIDVHGGILIMEFDGEIIKFNIYDSIEYPDDNNAVHSINMINALPRDIFEFNRTDELEVPSNMPNKEENVAEPYHADPIYIDKPK